MRRTSNELPFIVKRVTFDDVVKALPSFSYEGVNALVNLLEVVADAMGEPITLDAVALRSQYVEMTPSEVFENFPHPYKDSELAELDEDELWDLAEVFLDNWTSLGNGYFAPAIDTFVVDVEAL